MDKKSKIKRALRANEFKEKFEGFNSKLKCVAPFGSPQRANSTTLSVCQPAR